MNFKTTQYPPARPDTDKILKELTSLCCRNDRWFISGSYANRDITTPNDIDVYFEHPVVLHHAIANVKASKFITHTITENSLSFSFYHKNVPIRFQFIKKTGTPLEVLERFDLNVCKKVLFPDGTYLEHPDSLHPLSILKFDYDTVNRFFKYYRRFHPESTEKDIIEISKRFIDAFIGNNNLVIDEYLDSNKVSTVNNQVYEYFIDDISIKPYLIKAALKYSPDLLI